MFDKNILGGKGKGWIRTMHMLICMSRRSFKNLPLRSFYCKKSFEHAYDTTFSFCVRFKWELTLHTECVLCVCTHA
jgi:hypothetical protein